MLLAGVGIFLGQNLVERLGRFSEGGMDCWLKVLVKRRWGQQHWKFPLNFGATLAVSVGSSTAPPGTMEEWEDEWGAAGKVKL